MTSNDASPTTDLRGSRTSVASPDVSASPVSPGVVTGRLAAIVILTVLIADFMDLLDGTIVGVSAPVIAADLGASNAAVQWVVAGYTLALGAGLITGGRMGDLYGRRRLFMIGLAAGTIATIGCALAPTAEVLVAARVAAGLAGGLMVPQVFGIFRSSLQPQTRGKAFGAYGAVLSLAAVAGPLLGGILVQANLFGLSWRTIFWVNVPIGILGLLLASRFLPESRSERASGLDLVGAGLAALTVTLVLFPLIQGPGMGWPWWCFLLFGLATVTAAAFVVYERRNATRGRDPVFDPMLLRNRAFSAGLGASLLFFGAIGPFFLLFSFYLQQGTGRSALDTGLIILAYAIGSIITSGFGVQLAAKIGRILLVSGSLILAASQLFLLLVVVGGDNPSYWLLALPLFIGGLGLGLTAPPLIDVILAGVPENDASSASGVLTTVSQIGGALGVAVLSGFFFTTIATSQSAGDTNIAAYSQGLTAILVWQVIFYVVAAALMFLLPKRAAAHQEQAAPAS